MWINWALLTAIVLALSLPLGEGQSAASPLVRSIRGKGPPEKSVDVLFVGDGYSKRRIGKFFKDVKRYTTRLFKEPPFSWYRKKFTVKGVLVLSHRDGCDLSPSDERVPTFLESHFDSPTGRLLVYKERQKLVDLVRRTGPADIVFVMVNTEKYGGAGAELFRYRVRGRPLPTPVFSAQDTRSFIIALHELGHSFADLADEYADPDLVASYPLPSKGDIGAPNVTARGQFDPTSFETLKKTLKWRRFLELPGARKYAWIHEGGHYRTKGVFRPWKRCMMRDMGERFCPVCMEEMAKAIVLACGESWDGEAYRNQHPLRMWK